MSQPLESTQPALETRPISFDTRLTSIKTPVAIEYDSGEVVAVQVLNKTPKKIQMRIASANKGIREPRHRSDLNLGELALAVRKDRPLRAFSLPKGRVADSPPTQASKLASTLGVWSLIVTMMLGFAALGFATVATLWWLTLAGVIATALLFTIDDRIQTFHRRPVYRTGGRPYEIGTALVKPPPEVEAPDRSLDQINAVKEEYGTLLSDIIYRIEHPALFDVAVDTSRAFTTALLQWDNTASGLSTQERTKLAARIRLTFDAARQHAETVGLNHVPQAQRDDVTRAAKALRLAADAATEDEAVAARRRAVDILKSLTLYYLPDPDEAQAMIEGKPVLALPGRRREDDE